jgi:N6-L-threonylcarbamoyladenine synthase
VDAKAMVIGGGVAANSRLRTRLLDAATETGREAVLPSRSLCTDNAAMIAGIAYRRLLVDGPTPLSAGADPNLRLPEA